jgi:hypothetical protein
MKHSNIYSIESLEKKLYLLARITTKTTSQNRWSSTQGGIREYRDTCPPVEAVFGREWWTAAAGGVASLAGP